MSEDYKPIGLEDSSVMPQVSDSIPDPERQVLASISEETREDLSQALNAEPIVREFVQPGMPLYNRQGEVVLNVIDVNEQEYLLFHFFTPEERKKREKKGETGAYRTIQIKRVNDQQVNEDFRKVMKHFGAEYFQPLKLPEDLKAFTRVTKLEGLKSFVQSIKKGEVDLDNLEIQAENTPEALIHAIQNMDYGSQRLSMSQKTPVPFHEMTLNQLRVTKNIIKGHREAFLRKAKNSLPNLTKRMKGIYHRLVGVIEQQERSTRFVENLKKGDRLVINGNYDFQEGISLLRPVLDPVIVIEKVPRTHQKSKRRNTREAIKAKVYTKAGALVYKEFTIYHLELMRLLEDGRLQELEGDWKPTGKAVKYRRPAKRTKEIDPDVAFDQPIELAEHSTKDQDRFIKALRSSKRMANLDMELISDMTTMIESKPEDYLLSYLRIHEKKVRTSDAYMLASKFVRAEVQRLINGKRAWNELSDEALQVLNEYFGVFSEKQDRSVQKRLQSASKAERPLLEAKLSGLTTVHQIFKSTISAQLNQNQESREILSGLEIGDAFRLAARKVYIIRGIQKDRTGKVTTLECEVRDLTSKKGYNRKYPALRLAQKVQSGDLVPTEVGEKISDNRVLIEKRKKRAKTA